jgi:hypothetical protein
MAFAVLLPLVVGVEAIVLRRTLNTTLGQSLATAVAANVKSTVAGLPAGWCLAFLGIIPAGVLASLLPSAYGEPLGQIAAFTALTGGTIPTSFSPIAMAAGNLLILIPYYVYTIRLERRVVESRHSELEPTRVASAVRLMNRITYTGLACLVLYFLVTAIANYSRENNEPRSARATFADVAAHLRAADAGPVASKDGDQADSPRQGSPAK